MHNSRLLSLCVYVFILRITGYEIYSKWFDDNKCMKPVFSKIAATHTITRTQLMLLVTGAVRRTLKIN